MTPARGNSGLWSAVAVGGWLICFAVVVDASLSGLSRTPILGWLPRMIAGTGYLDDNRDRVEAASRWVAEAGPTRGKILSIVGISNVREGITVPALADGLGPDWHVLALGGAGLGLPDAVHHARLIIDSAFATDVAIIGTSLPQFLDSRPRPLTAKTGLLEHVKRADWRNVAVTIRDSSWAYSRRQDLSLAVSGAAADARSALFRWFHVTLPQSLALSPWREMIHSNWPDHFSANTLQEEERFFDSLGAFDVEAYRSSRRAPEALSSLIGDFRRKGVRVVVLLMPEHSTLRKRIPPSAVALVETRLSGMFDIQPPAIINLRDALTDDYFVDLAHLNAKGRAALSPLLLEALQPYVR